MRAADARTATRTSLRTAGIMVLFTVAFTALMASAYTLTRPTIEASQNAARLRLINELLPAAYFDNDLLADHIDIGPTPTLGLAHGGRIFRARLHGEPVALIVETVATDGYAGRIALAVAVAADGRVRGARVTEHRETPGLGDYIDPRKDRNKSRPWITQFDGASFAEVTPARWTVKRDGGHFDAPAGATISARATTHAIGRAARFAIEHADTLFHAAAGARLEDISE
nr:RnfABCDGE type electron transport complex subunit G [Zoogloeaceae bacterium]